MDRHRFDHARSAHTAVEPPHDAVADRIAKLLNNWRTIIVALAAFVAIGMWVGHWDDDHPRKADVAAVAAGARDVEKRVSLVERRLDDLRSDVKDMAKEMQLARQQLVEIAVKVGARQVDPPPTVP